MDKKDIDKELKKYIKARFLHGNGKKLIEDDSLFESGIIDSLGVLHLVSFIEEKFNIVIGDEEMIPENFETINKIIVFVKQKNGTGGKIETITNEQIISIASKTTENGKKHSNGYAKISASDI